MARRTKRLWTDEEKRSICFQTAAPGVSVAQVARRYAVNANLIFKWLRDPRYAPDPASVAPPAEEARFLPVEIVAETRCDVLRGEHHIADAQSMQSIQRRALDRGVREHVVKLAEAGLGDYGEQALLVREVMIGRCDGDSRSPRDRAQDSFAAPSV
ncbi:MAG: transposase [Pseudomonadota bacterium]